MKKILLCVVALILTTGAFAQLSWGLKGGLNLASLSNSDAGMKPSIYLGAFAEYTINNFIGIQPEIVYSRQGTFDKSEDTKIWLRANYINVPILAKLYLLENLSLDLGPQFGFLVGSKIKVKSDGTSVKMDIKDTFGSKLNAFDFSIAMGVTYKIIDNIDVSARYNLGVTNIIGEGGDGSNNGVIQIGVSYRF